MFNLSRYEEAIASYGKALEFKPDLYEAWDNFRKLATGQLLSFQDWLDLQQICKAGLEQITFEQDSIRHLTIHQHYLCSNSHYEKRKEAGMIIEIKEETPDVKQ